MNQVFTEALIGRTAFTWQESLAELLRTTNIYVRHEYT
jgi:hypothetical protein